MEGLRRQAVAPCDGGESASEVVREHDLGRSTFQRRVKRVHETGPSRAADSRTPEELRLLELECENARLRMETGVLEQAALMFARK